MEKKFSQGDTAVDEHGTNWFVRDVYRSLADGNVYYDLQTPCRELSKVRSKEKVEQEFWTLEEVAKERNSNKD